MKKLVGFFLLLIAAGGGWWYYVKYGTPPEKPQVLFAGISQGDIVEGVKATGGLEPVRRYDVGSQVSGCPFNTSSHHLSRGAFIGTGLPLRL